MAVSGPIRTPDSFLSLEPAKDEKIGHKGRKQVVPFFHSCISAAQTVFVHATCARCCVVCWQARCASDPSVTCTGAASGLAVRAAWLRSVVCICPTHTHKHTPRESPPLLTSAILWDTLLASFDFFVPNCCPKAIN